VEHRLSLALTCEEAGYLQEAKLQFERVREQSPDHPIAGAGLKRIEHQQEPEKGPTLMERIREAIASLMGKSS
jgi:hypothetical protein